MNAWLLLGTAALIVCFRAYVLWRKGWNHPLEHGPGLFLGNAVPPAFYGGEGARWLKRYRAVLAWQHAIEAAALAAILMSGRWELIPAWAGGGAVLSVTVMMGFSSYARRKLARFAPAPRRVAIALEPRRLSGYISWRTEAMMFAVLAASWLVLWLHPAGWQTPAASTWAVLALLPVKVLAVRAGRPLPAERTEEHHRWSEAHRRYSLRVVDSMRWLSVSMFAGYALLHGWPGAAGAAWLRWAVLAGALGASLYMMWVILRGDARLAAMGHNLRPVAAGAGIAPRAWIWMAVYLGGLAALLLAIPE